MGDLGDGEDVDEVEEELGRGRLLATAVAGTQVPGGAPGRSLLSDRGGDLVILFPSDLIDASRLGHRHRCRNARRGGLMEGSRWSRKSTLAISRDVGERSGTANGNFGPDTYDKQAWRIDVPRAGRYRVSVVGRPEVKGTGRGA
jgi:hypothetical protein